MTDGATDVDIADAIVVIAHLSERRRLGASTPAQAGNCCCCCCCCLHSLGGLIGATVAPNLGAHSRPAPHPALTHYWDDEQFPSGEQRPATHDQAAITANPPIAVDNCDGITANAPTEPLRQEQRTLASAEQNIALPSPDPSAVKLFWQIFLILVGSGLLISCLAAVTADGSWIIGGPIVLAMILPALQLVAATLAAVALSVSGRSDKRFELRVLAKLVLGIVAGTCFGLLAMTASIAASAPDAAVIPWLLTPAVVGGLAAGGLRRLSRQ